MFCLAFKMGLCLLRDTVNSIFVVLCGNVERYAVPPCSRQPVCDGLAKELGALRFLAALRVGSGRVQTSVNKK